LSGRDNRGRFGSFGFFGAEIVSFCEHSVHVVNRTVTPFYQLGGLLVNTDVITLQSKNGALAPIAGGT
jgi:hypothetical protein